MSQSRMRACRFSTSISDEAIFSSTIWSMERMSSSGMIHPRCLLRMLYSHVPATGSEMGGQAGRCKRVVALKGGLVLHIEVETLRIGPHVTVLVQQRVPF